VYPSAGTDAEDQASMKARIQQWSDAAVAFRLSKVLRRKAPGLDHGKLVKARTGHQDLQVPACTSGDLSIYVIYVIYIYIYKNVCLETTEWLRCCCCSSLGEEQHLQD